MSSSTTPSGKTRVELSVSGGSSMLDGGRELTRLVRLHSHIVLWSKSVTASVTNGR